MSDTNDLRTGDVQVLRGLAWRIREISQEPVMQERIELWTRHASLERQRPMLLAETGGVLDELIPVDTLECEADWARGMERNFRKTIFQHDSNEQLPHKEPVGADRVVPRL